jgi:hypothetical protein
MDISLYKLVFSKNKIPNQKYNSNIAEDNNNCVKGSVEVKIVMVDINIIYLHAQHLLR